MCKTCIARRLAVDIFLWCNANFVPFPSGTLVARQMQNGRIESDVINWIWVITYHIVMCQDVSVWSWEWCDMEYCILTCILIMQAWFICIWLYKCKDCNKFKLFCKNLLTSLQSDVSLLILVLTLWSHLLMMFSESTDAAVLGPGSAASQVWKNIPIGFEK